MATPSPERAAPRGWLRAGRRMRQRFSWLQRTRRRWRRLARRQRFGTGLAAPNGAAVLRRGDADHPLEAPCEVALIEEAGVTGNRAQRRVRFRQLPAREPDS